MTRTCSRCSRALPLDRFEKRIDRPYGRGYRCKECSARKSGGYYQRNVARRREYARVRGKTKPKNRALYRRLTSRELMEREPEKEVARRKLRNEVQKGRITKPSACESCSANLPQKKLHGHHDNYSRPLDVRWLCAGCHGLAHRKPIPLLPPEAPTNG